MASARALALALLVVVPRAAPAEAPRPLRYEPRQDLAITAGALVLWVGSELGKEALAAERCRVCATNGLDTAVRDGLVLSRTGVARRASDVVAFALMPAAVGAHQLLAARAAGDTREGARDLLFVAEAAALAATMNQVVKLGVGRQRPFVHFGNYADPDRGHDSDDNTSFYSGHASLAFSLAAAAGTVSTLRGYRSAPWVWAAGMTLATGVAYLRIASDMHYLTDALAGAVVGSAIGVGVPLLLHGREGAAGAAGGARVVPLPLGLLVVF
jgi:membrane-associated phospholipid phosphatase